jgi:eukaryotic-like serine/threonine-protein kinase
VTVLTGPPEIDGYAFLEPLGSGGFADVYLYEQELPRRTVAVKVLHGDISEQAVAAFLDEANLMAQLSAHPSIVTVLGAGVLPEDQRPYIVLEHCPHGNLGSRFRAETFSLQDALAMGIQLAGAVETAHRAGVLHRDIKPENVLITSLNRPALTDFGIASPLGAATSGEASGMSVPWSAPEVIDGSWSGPASDVYSLGATVYSLLAGRSPFESPDGPNGVLDHGWRILHENLPPTGRPDVPESLEGVLATAMSRSPQARYTSALSLARALQKVERDLGLEVTGVDVLDNGFSSLDASPGAGMPLRPVAAEQARPPVAPASLPTVEASLLATASAPASAMAAVAGTGAGFEEEALLADITLVLSPSAADSLRLDRPPPGAAAPGGTHDDEPAAEDPPGIASPSSDAEALELDLLAPSAVGSSGSAPPPRRPVWRAILIDLTLLAAVAGAGAVYLLLQ